MLALAGREADGAILNWLASSDVAACLAEVDNPDSTIVARIFVCPTEDAAYARMLGRRLISSYLTVGAYAEFHRWLGRGDVFGPMWKLWAEGDRAGASAAIPDEVVDALVLHGVPADCRRQVQRYVTAGVGVPVMMVLPTPAMTTPDAIAAILSKLGPNAAGEQS
jgi:alkanesulfonate monooxygenase SsuD/methylene tetrahydromethanopterin reductase-like flavin-dependent oxidoreductase (luciferase family)